MQHRAPPPPCERSPVELPDITRGPYTRRSGCAPMVGLTTVSYEVMDLPSADSIPFGRLLVGFPSITPLPVPGGWLGTTREAPAELYVIYRILSCARFPIS